MEEFKLLTKLDHPKIARVYEVFQDAWPDLKHFKTKRAMFVRGKLVQCRFLRF